MASTSFSINISAWVEKAKGRVDLVVRKVTLDMFSRIIMETPVDTGRLRGNWVAAIGNIPQGVLEVDDKEGTISISAADAVIAGVKAGDVVYLVNHLPYALRIEYGFVGEDSLGRRYNQSGRHMVGTTVETFKAAAERAARGAKEELP